MAEVIFGTIYMVHPLKNPVEYITYPTGSCPYKCITSVVCKAQGIYPAEYERMHQYMYSYTNQTTVSLQVNKAVLSILIMFKSLTNLILRNAHP